MFVAQAAMFIKVMILGQSFYCILFPVDICDEALAE